MEKPLPIGNRPRARCCGAVDLWLDKSGRLEAVLNPRDATAKAE
jgi:hypothetical protein